MIGAGARIMACSAVMGDVPAGETWGGVPAAELTPEQSILLSVEALKSGNFQAMLDSMPTMDLEGEAALADETEVKPGPAAKSEPRVPAQSGRRKSLRRRH